MRRSGMKFKLVIGMLTAFVLMSFAAFAVAADVGVKDAALGDSGVLVLKNDGSVWAWGSEAIYPKDLHAAGVIDPNPSPRKVMDDVISIAAGANAYFAVKSDNSLWAWGVGSLGDGKYHSNPTKPFKVMDGVKAVYAGSWVSGTTNVFIIKTDNSLWGWGNNTSGSLAAPFTSMPSSNKPVKIMDGVRHVAVGGLGHVLAIKTDDTLWTWGNNSHGQLGHGDTAPSHYQPKKIADNVETCAAGVNTSLFITKDHKLYGFGDASYNLLNQIDAPSPGAVEQIGGKWYTPRLMMENIISADIGYMHGAAVDTQGQLYVWGYYKSLGIPNLNFGAYKPRKGLLTGVKKVFVHSNYSLAIMNDNSVYAWGENGDGQVGTGTRSKNVATPVKVMEGGEYHPPVTATPTSPGVPTVSLDGRLLSFDVPPTIEQGRVLVPMRAIFEALGAEVAWDSATLTVTATKGQTRVQLTIGAKTAYKNDTPVTLDVPAKIVEGRTLVPLRFVSESLGAEVNWDAKTQAVTITSTTTGTSR